MGFSLSHNNELNSVVRGRAGADTPTSIQDNVVPKLILTNRRCQIKTKNQNGPLKTNPAPTAINENPTI